ncbi:MAG: hypothetical protein MJZ94_12125 [Bacteroidales bacterium]|nr:hypothetical protein [Bacteroidales bacterium]
MTRVTCIQTSKLRWLNDAARHPASSINKKIIRFISDFGFSYYFGS